ncbi:MAG: ribokinase [Pseudomonadales bacterium]
MGRVVVIGSINVDLTAVVERLPVAGETLTGSTFSERAGGKGANQALAAARAGATVRLAGAVGSDPFAPLALANLTAGGVDLTAVREVDRPTGTALILVGADGENVIVVVPGANAAVDPAQAAGLDLAAGDVLLLQGEIPLETLAAACARGRKAAARVLLNAAPFDAALADLLGQVNVLVVNELEAQALAGVLGIAARQPRELVAALAANDLDLIVTRGAGGLVAALDGEIVEVPALGVDVVDTVGAGDAFCGYLAAGIARDGGLDAHLLRRASVAASLTCMRSGAQEAIPTLAEVLRAGG